MTKQCSTDTEFMTRYATVWQWYSNYRTCLETLEQDHEFLCGGSAGEERAIRVVLDAYDVVRFCFPFNTGLAVMRRALEPDEQVLRAQLLREHAARACILYGLPSLQSVIVLPPHFAELVSFFETVGHHVGMAAIERELAPLLLRMEPTAKQLAELTQRVENPACGAGSAIEAQLVDLVALVTEGFDELAMILMGVYSDGFRILENLLRKKRVVGVDAESALEGFFSDLDGVLDQTLSGARTREPEHAAVLDWFRIFSKLRPGSALRNIDDAKVIQEVMEGNRMHALGAGTALILVSGAKSMHKAVASGGEAAVTSFAGETPRPVVRTTDTFYYYLQISEELPPSLGGGPHGRQGAEVHRRNLGRIRDELQRLAAFEESRQLVDKQFERCGIDIGVPRPGPTSSCYMDCALRDERFRRQLEQKLADLDRRRVQTEDARSLRKRHPLLCAYIDIADTEASSSGVRARARSVLDQLAGGASWETLLDTYIAEIERLFASGSRDIFADLSPFSRDLPERFVDYFFEFPFAVHFTNRRLQAAAADLAGLAVRTQTGGDRLTVQQIQMAIRSFRLAAAAEQDPIELDLVRALLLFAFEDWDKALSAVEAHVESAHPAAPEFALLAARCHIQVYMRNPTSPKPLLIAQTILSSTILNDEDPRRERLLGIVLSLLLLYYPEKARPHTREDIEDVYRAALTHAVAWEHAEIVPLLEVSILNSWAYFLAHFDEAANRHGLELVREMHLKVEDRANWYMTWTHTEGSLWLALARHAQGTDLGEQRRLAAEAVLLLRQALDGASSEWLRDQVDKDLREAELLAAGGSRDHGFEIESE
jgi:hypothetical protein